MFIGVHSLRTSISCLELADVESYTYQAGGSLVSVHLGLTMRRHVDFLIVSTFDPERPMPLSVITEYYQKSKRTRFQINLGGEHVDPRGSNQSFIVQSGLVTFEKLALDYREIRRLVDNSTEIEEFKERLKMHAEVHREK